MLLATEYLSSSIKRLKYYKSLANKTFDQLSDEQLHFQPNTESNSIAVNIQHMAGNMLSRWTDFLSSDGEKEWRDRDAEFEDKELTKEKLLQAWEQGWACFIEALEKLTEQDLLKIITIRGEQLTAIDAVNRQLAHYPYHVGQIVYMGRIIKGKDWKNLSIPPGGSVDFNKNASVKDPGR
jgi:uncharacterized damage-inducible protein DinB